MRSPVNVAQSIPVSWRRAIYGVLPVLVLVEGEFDFVSDPIESKILKLLILFGFGTAISNTLPSSTAPLPPPPPPSVDN
jgi:hypothetical protein